MAYRLPDVHFYAIPRVHRQAERIFRREIDDVLMHYSDNDMARNLRHCARALAIVRAALVQFAKMLTLC